MPRTHGNKVHILETGINRGNCILIVFHLHRCSKQNILEANYGNLARSVTLTF